MELRATYERNGITMDYTMRNSRVVRADGSIDTVTNMREFEVTDAFLQTRMNSGIKFSYTPIEGAFVFDIGEEVESDPIIDIVEEEIEEWLEHYFLPQLEEEIAEQYETRF